MGRQVNFYMTGEDEKEFVNFVRATGDIVIFPSRSLQRYFQPVDELPEPFSNEHWLGFLFYNRGIFVKPGNQTRDGA